MLSFHISPLWRWRHRRPQRAFLLCTQGGEVGEGRGYMTDRRLRPLHHPLCPHQNQSGGRAGPFLGDRWWQPDTGGWRSTFPYRGALIKPGQEGRSPPQCRALTCSQVQTELASGHHRNCHYEFRWRTRGCLAFYYCGWSHEPLQQ